jgi:hypothetical protein
MTAQGFFFIRWPFLVLALIVFLSVAGRTSLAQDYVEGITAVASSADGSQLDTYSETFETIDLAYYYGAYVQGELEQNGVQVAQVASLESPATNDAIAEMTVNISPNNQYQMESDHYIVAAYYYIDQGHYYYYNPSYFLISSGGSDYPPGYNYSPGGGPLYYEYYEYFYLFSTIVEVSSAPPHITSINPNSASVESSGTITILGSDLVDPFTLTANPAITGSGVTIGVHYQSQGEVDLSYSISSHASTGSHYITLSDRFGVSNQVAFNVGDPTPNITSVSPNIWDANTTIYPVTIGGTGFGTNPTLTISGQGVTLNSYSGSDTQITASVTIAANAPNETANITVTSNGYYGSGWVATQQGQPNNNTATATVSAAAATAANILYFGHATTSPTAVAVGQQISLTTTIPGGIPQGTSVTTNSWVIQGIVIKDFSGSQAGDIVHAWQNPNTTSTSFYWVSNGNVQSQTYSAQYSYCLNTGVCSPTTTADFTVGAPYPVGVTPSTTSVIVFFNPNGNPPAGPLLAFQSWPAPGPGVNFLVHATNYPPSGQGQYQWVQLLTTDEIHYVEGGLQNCNYIGLAGPPWLDDVYPYGTGYTGTVYTTAVTNDNADDSPNTGLPSAVGDMEREFAATMFVRWIPQADPSCTSGAACTIPVPLGSESWGWCGDAVNTGIIQPYPNLSTYWLSCAQYSQSNLMTFVPSTPGPGAYLGWNGIDNNTCQQQ